MIEEASSVVPLIRAPRNLELLDGAHELAGQASGLAIGSRIGETGELVAMFRHRGGEMIVHLARERDAVGAGHEIGAGARIGKHLHCGCRPRPST